MSTPLKHRWFEDCAPGETFEFTEEQIVDFARRYDPQPFHVDAAAAAQSNWQQAHAVVALLAREGIKRIVASPLVRAQQTALPLAERLRLPIQTVDAGPKPTATWPVTGRSRPCARRATPSGNASFKTR